MQFITRMFTPSKSDQGKPIPQAMPMPEAPKVEDASDLAQKKARARRALTSKTVFTSPLGMAGEADVTRKTLLGQ